MANQPTDPPTTDIDQLLREGIAAAKAGQKERAHNLLMRVLDQDEKNAMAWLWLSGVVDSLEDREICLENVLTLDPENTHARKGLDLVRSQMRAQARPVEESAPAAFVTESPVVARASEPVSMAAAILREDFERRRPPPEPEPPAPTTTIWDELEDEYLCPWCSAPTEHDDRKCASCGEGLWVKLRKREKPSNLYWVVVLFQLVSTIYLGSIPVLALVYAGLNAGTLNLTEMINVYFGLPTTLPAAVVSDLLATVPRLAFFLSVTPLLFSFAVLVGLYLRWKPVYYLFVVDAAIELLGAVAWLVLGASIYSGVAGLIIALARLLLIFQINDDFAHERRRILLRVDKGVTGTNALMVRAEDYAKRKMWATAVLHLRRVASWRPEKIGVRLALATNCLRMKRYDLAEQALKEAQGIDPDNLKAKDIAKLLDELQSRQTQQA